MLYYILKYLVEFVVGLVELNLQVVDFLPIVTDIALGLHTVEGIASIMACTQSRILLFKEEIRRKGKRRLS